VGCSKTAQYQIFTSFDENPKGEKCAGTEGSEALELDFEGGRDGYRIDCCHLTGEALQNRRLLNRVRILLHLALTSVLAGF